MKTAICKPNYQTAFSYPNAATRRELLYKVLDTILVAVSGMGIGAMLLLLMVL